MSLSLANNKDIVGNGVAAIKGNRLIDLAEAVEAVQGFAPETLSS